MPVHQKKRAYEKARPAANTKLAEKKIRKIRVMGGNFKFRALSNNAGNFTFASEGFSAKTTISNVIYHPSDNEHVRTNTLTKGAIVRIDATPFRNYLARHYFGHSDATKLHFNFESKDQLKKVTKEDADFKYLKRRVGAAIDPKLQELLNKSFAYACISSRPGQSGRVDGYILEGRELEFYLKKLEKK